MGKNKRSRSFYIQSAKRQKRRDSVLNPDMCGFLCTCNGHERDCVREAYNILNEIADEIYGKEVTELQEEKEGNGSNVTEGKDTEAKDSDEDDLDVEAAIKSDMSELTAVQKREKKLRRFQQVECGANGCVFINTTLEDPVRLSLAIMDNILQTQKQKTKKLLRMIPVQKTCKAHYKDIEKAVEALAKVTFEKESKSYYIAYKIRNNSSLERDELTKKLIDIIQATNPNNVPDLKTPDIVLNVEVVKTICCLSFLPGYFNQYCKYNLIEIAKKKEPKQDEVKENIIAGTNSNGSKVESINEKSKVPSVTDAECDKEVKSSDAAGDKEVKSIDAGGDKGVKSSDAGEVKEAKSSDAGEVKEAKSSEVE